MENNALTKIEVLIARMCNESIEHASISDETLEEYNNAIREEVVIDALSSEKIKTLSMGDKKAEWAMTLARTAMIESITTCKEVVIDAFPNDDECYEEFMSDRAIKVANWMRNKAIERITTRKEIVQPYVELLMELAGIALPYMTTEQKQKLNSLTDGK